MKRVCITGIAVLGLLVPQVTFGAVFTSVQTGNWNDPATWGLSSGDPTPGMGDEIHYGLEGILTVTESVSFGGSGTASTWTGNGAAGSIHINLESGVTLTHLAGGTMTYDITNRTGAFGGDGIVNYGTWIHENGDFNVANSTSATFTNHGTYLHPASGAGSDAGFFNRDYHFVNSADGVFEIDRDYQWSYAQGPTTLSYGSAFENDGVFRLNEFTLTAFEYGWGGRSPSLPLGATSTIATTLTGHDPADSGKLLYRQDLVLNGGLAVELAPGFTPDPGDEWTIIEIDQSQYWDYSISGSFDSITPGFRASIRDGGKRLVLAAVPEPSTLAIWSLLATLSIAVGWWRQNRNTVQSV